jgi:hypothetical protein
VIVAEALNSYQISVILKDLGKERERTFNVTVTNNVKPEIHAFMGNLSVTVPYSKEFNFEITDLDTPLSSLTVSAYLDNSLLPSWMSFNQTSQKLKVYNFNNSHAGNYFLHLEAYDECGEDEKVVGSTMAFTVIQNVPPSITSTISNKQSFKAQGDVEILIPTDFVSDAENDFVITAKASYSAVKSINVYQNKILEFSTNEGFVGNFSIEVIVTDNNNQTVSSFIDITVLDCFEPSSCASCNGPMITDWLKCETGYKLQGDGKWQANSILDHHVDPDFFPAASITFSGFLISSLFATSFADMNSKLEFLIFQFQIFLSFPATELYIPDNYVSFINSFGIFKNDFKMLDFMGIDEGLKGGIDKDGHKNMTRIEYNSGSFIVNEIYSLFFLGFVVLFHVIISIVSLLKWTQKLIRCKMLLHNLQKSLKFSFYLKFLVVSSLFIFLLILSEIIGSKMNTGGNIGSFLITIIVLICLIVVLVIAIIKAYDLPLILGDDEIFIQPTKLNRIFGGFYENLKITRMSRLYYPLTIIHRILFAFTLIIFTSGMTQVLILALIGIIYTIYVCIVRPYKSVAFNMLIVSNQAYTMIMIFILFQVTETKDYTVSGFNSTVGYMLIAICVLNLAILMVVLCSALFSAVVTLCKNLKNPKVETVNDGKKYVTNLNQPQQEEVNSQNLSDKSEEVIDFEKIEELKQEMEKIQKEEAEQMFKRGSFQKEVEESTKAFDLPKLRPNEDLFNLQNSGNQVIQDSSIKSKPFEEQNVEQEFWKEENEPIYEREQEEFDTSPRIIIDSNGKEIMVSRDPGDLQRRGFNESNRRGRGIRYRRGRGGERSRHPMRGRRRPRGRGRGMLRGRGRGLPRGRGRGILRGRGRGFRRGRGYRQWAPATERTTEIHQKEVEGNVQNIPEQKEDTKLDLKNTNIEKDILNNLEELKEDLDDIPNTNLPNIPDINKTNKIENSNILITNKQDNLGWPGNSPRIQESIKRKSEIPKEEIKENTESKKTNRKIVEKIKIENPKKIKAPKVDKTQKQNPIK